MEHETDQSILKQYFPDAVIESEVEIEIEITHYDVLDNTLAAMIATEGHLENMRAGSPRVAGNHWSHHAILASIAGEPVGVITWEERKHANDVYLNLGYVKPAQRGRGIYTKLWNALVEKARELKQPTIRSTTRLDNSVMRAVAKAQGRVETSVELQFVVPKA